MAVKAASIGLGHGYFWTAWEIHGIISTVAVLLNLCVHDSEFLQLRAISGAYAQFVWVCLERGRGGYT